MDSIEMREYGGKPYKFYHGTFYHPDTPDGLIRELDRLLTSGGRIKIFYGDAATGELWTSEHDTEGYIGRTTGPVKSLILVHNSRSSGGGLISTDSILRIEMLAKKRQVWQADKMIVPDYKIKPSETRGYIQDVYIGGELYSRHSKPGVALRLVTRLGLDRLKSVGVAPICPNCGHVFDADDVAAELTNCPSCGYGRRGANWNV